MPHARGNDSRQSKESCSTYLLENTIVKLQRKDAHIAQRYADNKLTVRDVEVIIRRSTYSALKLKMVPIGLENLQ